MKQSALFLAFFVAIVSLTGCEDPHEHDDDHMDIVGFEIREGDQVIISQARNAQTGDIEVMGQINVAQGETTPILTVYFIEPDGHEVEFTSSEFSLNFNPVNTQIITLHHDASQSRWGFRVEGKQPGTELVTLSLNHGDHADFESRQFTVEVHGNVD
jgi:hypothetical protein